MTSYKTKKDWILEEIDHNGYSSTDETFIKFNKYFGLGYGVYAKTLTVMMADGIVVREKLGQPNSGWVYVYKRKEDD